MPRMRHQLRTGATILLDDAQRPEEQRVLRQWEQEAGWRHVIEARGDKAYAVVTVS